MAKDVVGFLKQYRVNGEALKKVKDPFLTGVNYLEREYNRLVHSGESEECC